MRRYKHQAIFALNVVCALIILGLLTLDTVGAEAALTNSKMMPPRVVAANVER